MEDVVDVVVVVEVVSNFVVDVGVVVDVVVDVVVLLADDAKTLFAFSLKTFIQPEHTKMRYRLEI